MPTRSLPLLIHIGTLNPSDKGRSYSHSLEGHGLSVSRHPEEWKRIAKISGPWWALRKPDASFLDANNVDPAQRREIEDWAIGKRYVARVRGFEVRYEEEDEDGGIEECSFQCLTRAEAEDEAEELEDAQIEKVEVLKPRRALRLALGGMKSELDEFDHLMPLYVEQETGLDGVWWDDRLDPLLLSAPRGVIVPSRLDGFRVRLLGKGDAAVLDAGSVQ